MPAQASAKSSDNTWYRDLSITAVFQSFRAGGSSLYRRLVESFKDRSRHLPTTCGCGSTTSAMSYSVFVIDPPPLRAYARGAPREGHGRWATWTNEGHFPDWNPGD